MSAPFQRHESDDTTPAPSTLAQDYDPFAGLGTVPLRAVMLDRIGWGTELNPSYYRDACAYLKAADAGRAMPTLFDLNAAENDDTPVLDAVSPLRPSVVVAPVSDGAQRTVFELLKAEVG